MFQPRPKQQEVLDYRGGTMGVSAVPGSGKTWTLSMLAAELIASGKLMDEQEILIVTLVNAAVNNFSQRIARFVQERGLLPQLGYRVRTLHGLAHDIVRENPSRVGLDTNFQIIDERAADDIRNNAAQSWLRTHRDQLEGYLQAELSEYRHNKVISDDLPKLVNSVSISFIRYAKDLGLSAEQIRRRLEQIPLPLPLAQMGCDIYEDYQRGLAYRAAVDFDDLIRLALMALRSDAALLERLQNQWPYILEDEAQDSSRMQEDILRLLAGPGGNWVRVGDPNQAIYETFTTANPRYLREFIKTAEYPRQLPNSGRSTQSVINLANELIRWTTEEHPTPAVRNALSEPYILPTPPGDPDPNPPDNPQGVFLVSDKYNAQQELDIVAGSIARWLPDHPDETVAVLAPRNDRGFQLADLLRKKYQIEPVDSLLRSSSGTRQAAGALANIVGYLADPQSVKKLATVFRVWRRDDRNDEELAEMLNKTSKLIAKCPFAEDFLLPRPDRDWLESTALQDENPQVYQQLVDFRNLILRWQAAVLLPIDQLLLTLAQDVFENPTDLAVAHKLGLLLRQAANNNPDWRLPELTAELTVIAKNERRFIGLSEDDLGFDPDNYRGKVVIVTMHKAKGLEWDRVYLMSVSNYDFPSGMEYDRYMPERWFIRDRLNLEAETLAQLDAALSQGDYDWYTEGVATEEARMEYVRERIRLFFVAITRARKELIVTWNTGRQGNSQQAFPFAHLYTFWENRK